MGQVFTIYYLKFYFLLLILSNIPNTLTLDTYWFLDFGYTIKLK